jgi:glutamine synthetase
LSVRSLRPSSCRKSPSEPTDLGGGFLPDNIYDAIRLFKGSRFMQEVMGEDVHAKYAELKLAQAERCPKALGTLIKASEVQYHHEVTNQFLWSQF